jgi:hypothetical protein
MHRFQHTPLAPRYDELQSAVSALANHPACSTNSITSEPRPCLGQDTPKRREKAEIAKSRVGSRWRA